MRLDELNALDHERAAGVLLACCGSTQWAARMAAVRPFASIDALMSKADAVWTSLEPADWLEAFAAHPRIGERPRSAWEAGEQAAVARDAGDAAAARLRLQQLNREYEARFGYIFIVCATGKGADEMIALLERRLRNNPGNELRAAAAEQGLITRLRLEKLLT